MIDVCVGDEVGEDEHADGAEGGAKEQPETVGVDANEDKHK